MRLPWNFALDLCQGGPSFGMIVKIFIWSSLHDLNPSKDFIYLAGPLCVYRRFGFDWRLHPAHPVRIIHCGMGCNYRGIAPHRRSGMEVRTRGAQSHPGRAVYLNVKMTNERVQNHLLRRIFSPVDWAHGGISLRFYPSFTSFGGALFPGKDPCRI